MNNLKNLLVAGLATSACASRTERVVQRDLDRVGAQLAPLDDRLQARPAATDEIEVQLDGTLASYLAHAYGHSPDLRASFEDWRALAETPRQARRLPEPTLTYAFFIRSVETRVGPQRHKLGVSQFFPWPTKLTAGGQAAALEARAAQHRFQVHALQIAEEVSRAYWNLWRTERAHEIDGERIVLLEGLTELMRVRMEVGQADMSDASRVALLVSRTRDHREGLVERRRMASAELVRAIGAPAGTATPVNRDALPPSMPAESEEALRRSALKHPRVETQAVLSRASEQRARAARADRFPGLGLGVDWIITGESSTPMVSGSGKDAVIAMASMRLPLWQPAYGAAERQARAQAAASRARERATRDRVVAALSTRLAAVRDAARRVELHRSTLLPQAEGAYSSVQNSYQSGRATAGELLPAEQAWLDLRLGQHQAEADLGTAWAELESVVGREVSTRSPDHE